MLHIYLCIDGHNLWRKAENIENLTEITIIRLLKETKRNEKKSVTLKLLKHYPCWPPEGATSQHINIKEIFDTEIKFLFIS